jgi:hypothetical protein
MFGWCCFYTQYTFFSLAHGRCHYDSNNNYMVLLFPWILIQSHYDQELILLGQTLWRVIENSPKLKWFTIATLIWVTTAAVWKHGLRSLVCKCLFPYDPGWNWTHIRYLTCETHVTLTDDLADLENFSCLVTLKTIQYKWFTRLGI